MALALMPHSHHEQLVGPEWNGPRLSDEADDPPMPLYLAQQADGDFVDGELDFDD